MSVAENIFTSLWNLLENGAIKGKNIDHVTMHHEVNVRCKKLRKWQNKKEEEVNGSGREQTRVVLLWSTSSNAQYKNSIPHQIFLFLLHVFLLYYSATWLLGVLNVISN